MSRILPPVRISFVADTKQFDKAADDVLRKVQQVANSAVRVQGTAAGARAVKMAVQTAVQLMERHLCYAAQQLVSTIHTVQVNTRTVRTAMRDATNVAQTALVTSIRRMVVNAHTTTTNTRAAANVLRQATDLVLHYLLINIRRMVASVHSVRSAGTQQVNTTVRQAVDVVLHSVLRYIRRLVANVHNVRFSTAQVNRTVRDAIDVAANAIISSIRASFLAAATAIQNRPIFVPMIRAGLRRIIRTTMQSMLQTIQTSMAAGTAAAQADIARSANRFVNGTQRSASRLLQALTRQATQQMNAAAAIPNIPGNRQAGGGRAGARAGAGGENFSTMGARADLYMHTMALRSIAKQSSGVFDLYMQYQDLNVAMEAFTGGATSAAKVMAEIQDYAIKSPYDTIALGNAARNMMAYGQSSTKTLEIMKMMGDVAGGNSERFNLLMYAMSQITSLGKLQGNELRQLTEQGFNPLVYWAEKTKGANESLEQAMERMYDAKKKGLITSEMVIEALKAETSAGGRFHEMAKRMNETLRGLSNQVKEMAVKVSNLFLAYLEPSAKATLKYILEMQNAIYKWATEPKNMPLAAKIADIARKALLAVAAFHVVGIAIAGMAWWGRAASIVFTRLRTVALMPLIVVIRIARAGVMLFSGTLAVLRGMFVVTAFACTAFNVSMLAASNAARVLATTATLVASGFRIMGMYTTMASAALWAHRIRVLLLTGSYAGFVAVMGAVRAASVASAAGMWAAQIAAIGLRGAMVVLRLAALLAWAAVLGPVALIIAAIGAVALGVWMVIQSITGTGGLAGAFVYAWSVVKWFWDSANGFFSNFGENMQILSKYVYENWATMFSEVGTIALKVLSAIPNNFMVALRAGTRLFVAFGSWLGVYLPSAFESAYNAVYNFLADFFYNILQAGKAVWEYITNPSKWGTSGFGKQMNMLIDDMRRDTGVVIDKGLGAAANQILTEESKNLKTGLEDFKTALPGLQLNLKPSEVALPEPPAPDMPRPDKQFGPGAFPDMGTDAAKKGKELQSIEAMSATGGAYSKFMADYAAKMGSGNISMSPQVTEQKETNKLIRQGNKIMQEHLSQKVNFFPAGVGGIP